MASWYETYWHQHKTLSLWVTSIKTHCYTFSCLVLFSPKSYLDLGSRNSDKGLSVDKFTCNLANTTCLVLAWSLHMLLWETFLGAALQTAVHNVEGILLEGHNIFGDDQQNGQEGM